MKNILPFVLLASALAACGGKGDGTENRSSRRIEMEGRGQECLARARTQLSRKKFADARKLVDSMRRAYPLALNAREEGILLMDSLDLAEAQDSLAETDSLLLGGTLKDDARRHYQARFEELCQKVKFFKRKLHHDKQNVKKH